MNSIAVLVATYRRPDPLRNLLSSLEAARRRSPFDVIVIDNDPSGSARDICSESGLVTEYAVEATPGIAAARNAALDLARDRYDFLAFVDDDERVHPDWLTSLLQTQETHDADVISGPVVPILPEHAPNWIVNGRFHARPDAETGSRTRWPATNNCLVRASALSRTNRFSAEFSITGGSDTEFFWQLEQAGATFVWCNEALVEEDVPTARLSATWLWRRGRRLGNVSSRMLMIRGWRRPTVIGAGVGRLLLSPAIVIGALLRRRAWGPAAMNLPKAVGMVEAAFGNHVQEYKR